MNVKSHIPKLLQTMLSLFLAVAVISTTISLPNFTLTTYAAEGNGTDEDGGQGTQTQSGWPSQSRTGWILYLVENQSDTVVSDARAYSCSGVPVTSGYVDMTTRIGNMSATPCGIGVPWIPSTPFTSTGGGNGTEIKDWMLADDGSGAENWYKVVQGIWGDQVAQDMAQNDWSLIMEPFYWAKLNEDTGWVCATARGWGRYLRQMYGEQAYGPSSTARYTNNVFAQCAKFAYDKWGLTAYLKGGKLTNSEMEFYAVGIMSITPLQNGIHTWDQALGSTPGPAPDHPTKIMPPQLNIVKNYRTHNLTTGAYTDDGCFTRSNVVNKIFIDDEPEYKVIGWKVSTTTSTPDSINWNPPGTISKSGTTSGTTTLEKIETCLYVLLEKVEEEETEPQDYNYKITQSSITRRIHLSNPDNWLSMPMIQNHTFTWILPQHQTSCSGHTYYTACNGHSHKDSCPDDCSSSHNCGSNCVANTEYCSGFDWYDKTLKLSVTNTQKNNYPDILATKSGWNFETEQGKLTKHWYKDNTTFNRESTGAVVYTDTNWDYVCVIHRGKDKLTLAQWINSSLVNSDLRDVSGSGYAVANTLQGTRKLQDYYDKFSAQF